MAAMPTPTNKVNESELRGRVKKVVEQPEAEQGDAAEGYRRANEAAECHGRVKMGWLLRGGTDDHADHRTHK